MPRKKKAIPTALEGRAHLAAMFEQCSQDTVELACRLRKPLSLIRGTEEAGYLEETVGDLQKAAQGLSDLAVDVSLGRVAVAQAEPPRDDQRMLFDGIGEPSEN